MRNVHRLKSRKEHLFKNRGLLTKDHTTLKEMCMSLYKSQPIGLGLDTFLVALSLKVRKRDEKVFLLGY